MDELRELRERAKELRCLYRVNEIVSRRGQSPTDAFLAVLEAIPQGWQRPDSTGARIEYLGRSYVGPGYSSSGNSICEPIRLERTEVGRVEVSDTSVIDDEGMTFLDEEKDLLRNVAHRLGEYLEWKHTELLGGRATTSGVHWRWRESYAEAMAAALDPNRFNVLGVYLGGSTEGGNAGPGSDIDLIVVCQGSAQRDQLSHWFEGWSLPRTGWGVWRGSFRVEGMPSLVSKDRRYGPVIRAAARRGGFFPRSSFWRMG